MNQSIQKNSDRPFSVPIFLFTVVATIVAFTLFFKAFWPSMFESSMRMSIWKWVVTFLIAHLCCGFAEFFFHRYMLHAPFPLFSKLYKKHTHHHSLTNVRLISIQDGEGRVFNRYPILEEKQHEASYFPWYSLSGFITFFLPFLIPLQFVLPSYPILGASVLALAWSITLYEIVHMIEHFSFENFWKPKVTGRHFGRIWTFFYCFHLRHHAENKFNENISGFFTIPIADFVFGTYAPWSKAYEHGETVPETEFGGRVPKPCFLIRFLDEKFT